MRGKGERERDSAYFRAHRLAQLSKHFDEHFQINQNNLQSINLIIIKKNRTKSKKETQAGRAANKAGRQRSQLRKT